MTTDVRPYTKNLLEKILASIPMDFDKMLIVNSGEPNTLQLLKLAIQAFFNNVLRSPFIDIHGNDIIKALWLLKNIDCSQQIFTQYNYLDYFPFTNDTNTEYIPSFMSNVKREGNILNNWLDMNVSAPNLIAANTSLARARHLQHDDVWQSFQLYIDEEQQTHTNLQTLATKLLFDVGEFNSTLDKFIDIFLPITRDESDTDLYLTKENERMNMAMQQADYPIFSEHTICLLAMSNDGSKILTIHTETPNEFMRENTL